MTLNWATEASPLAVKKAAPRGIILTWGRWESQSTAASNRPAVAYASRSPLALAIRARVDVIINS